MSKRKLPARASSNAHNADDADMPMRGNGGTATNGLTGKYIDPREERLFHVLDDDNDAAVEARDIEAMLAHIGIDRHDRRISESMEALRAEFAPDTSLEEHRQSIDRGDFCRAIRPNILLIERALQGRMVIPDFKGFSDEISEIFEVARRNQSGAPANYIPQLDLQGIDADRFGVGLCTVDGQRFALGDSKQFFSVQSTTKPISYCLALEEHGPEVVHRYVGHEPSGFGFNEITLNKLNQPHNPMINAGAIMSSALIKLSDKQHYLTQVNSQTMGLRGWAGERFDYVMNRWHALCGNEMPRFSTSVFLSERETADRNFALAYIMRENQAFPDGVDLQDVLEFYFQTCSIEVNVEMMSVIAATLANGGICPTTGERVFTTETVRNCLSLMAGCGMYDFSGEFAFSIGLPAKSGVSGGIMVVVPNVMGFATWSPRLDELGNSVRGIEFCRRLVETFNFHNFDNLTGNTTKKDPRLNPVQVKAQQVNEMIWAASKGDLGALQDQLQRGATLGCGDYDLRTPLHLAAAENQAHMVRFFVETAAQSGADVSLNPRDRWGGTPLDDAYLQGHGEVIAILEQAGAQRGQIQRSKNPSPPRLNTALYESAKTDELIWAASLGELNMVRRLVAQGVPLDLADYDHRTAMHLAAAEGHLDVVKYLIAHGVPVNPNDRWGDTPLTEAIRHGHEEVATVLKANGGKNGASNDGHTGTAASRRAA